MTTRDQVSYKPEVSSRDDADLLAARSDTEAERATAQKVHTHHGAVVCSTESRGHKTPDARSPLEIVIDASEGFIPLWGPGVTLRWKFDDVSLAFFQHPEAIKERIRELFGEAVLLWGDASPVRFSENDAAYDFKIVVSQQDNCNVNGCTLARAFFPDGGRHDLVFFPRMFTQSRKEQVDTVLHEIGHVFGLRHFFAQVSETAWPSEVFGNHRAFSIMNYGVNSELTSDDRNDLRNLYRLAWSGELRNVNGTPIRFVRPYHELAGDSKGVVAPLAANGGNGGPAVAVRCPLATAGAGAWHTIG